MLFHEVKQNTYRAVSGNDYTHKKKFVSMRPGGSNISNQELQVFFFYFRLFYSLSTSVS